MTKGDQRDNDCDNRADEEECNSIDDDGDGLVDEDCEAGTIEAFGNSYVIMFMENNVDDNPNAQSFLEVRGYLRIYWTGGKIYVCLTSEAKRLRMNHSKMYSTLTQDLSILSQELIFD